MEILRAKVVEGWGARERTVIHWIVIHQYFCFQKEQNRNEKVDVTLTKVILSNGKCLKAVKYTPFQAVRQFQSSHAGPLPALT